VVCSIEGWSKTPTVVEFEAMARKQFNLQLELHLAEKNPTLPMPPQWIISPGRPVGALAAIGATADPERPPGFYRSVALLGQRVVVLSELPKTAETRLLRLMGPPEMRQEVRNELAALAEDDPTRQALLAILNKLSYFLKNPPRGCSHLLKEKLTIWYRLRGSEGVAVRFLERILSR